VENLAEVAHSESCAGVGAPEVIDLGDAATLTRGSDQQSVENKQDPYD
jgi:hypothetical protein